MTRVMAFDANIDNEDYSNLDGFQSLILRPGEDRIVWEMSDVKEVLFLQEYIYGRDL
ncbi:MAG: hypothetical protein K6G19_02705 [Lachnospiraceae bacterium]|nr:hypothetical protein [Lachnospiraceae bacterium]